MTNKEIVLKMYEVIFNGHDLRRASEFIKEDYIQHNPRAKTGLEGFVNFFRDTLFKAHPEFKAEIKNIFAEGDYVVVHFHANFGIGEPGAVVVDIYRMENGKAAEHWDVVQPMPTEFAHNNGMF